MSHGTNTPKAFANFSPGLERLRQPWVWKIEIVLTLKGLPGVKPFQGLTILFVMHPGFSLRSNPGLKLGNTFGVKEPTPLVLISQHLRY